MDIKIRALDTFQHGYYRGRLDADAGATYEVPQSEADDLVKAGLAEIVTITAEVVTEEPPTAEPETDLDDLVGGEKAEEAPENKMAPAPANKGKK